MSEKIKTYTLREDRLSAYLHLAGCVMAAAAAIPLYRLAAQYADKYFTAGIIFYNLSLLAMFGASGFYHLCCNARLKAVARKFDHCAIYLLISGTYAPLITGAVRSQSGYIILAGLITLSVLGIAGKYFFANKIHFLEVFIYIVMGWAALFIGDELLEAMSYKGMFMLASGGVIYTAGVGFYAVRKEFFHAIWHVFVLVGALLHLGAVLTIVPY